MMGDITIKHFFFKYAFFCRGYSFAACLAKLRLLRNAISEWWGIRVSFFAMGRFMRYAIRKWCEVRTFNL